MPEGLTFGYFHYGPKSIDLFLESIRRVYPGAVLVNCAFQCSPGVEMAARTYAYAKLRKTVRGNLVLCDTDMEARKPLDIWGDDFHIGLTKSEEETPLMPFNGGMIFCKDTQEAQGFLDQVTRCATIVPKGFGDRMWYIDQLALGYVAKGNPSVKVFPGAYNYVPKFCSDKPDVYFIHYKGSRKSWQ